MAPKGGYRSHLGDPFPSVPMGHFRREKSDMATAWELVGPTIGRNWRHSDTQRLCCIAFIEGMRMATFVANDVAPEIKKAE